VPLTVAESARSLRRHWRIPAAVLVLCLGAIPFLLGRTNKDARYNASAALRVERVDALPQLVGAAQAPFITGPEVTKRAFEIARTRDPGKLKVTANVADHSEVPTDPDFVTIQVTSDKRDAVEPIAAAQAQAYIEFRGALQQDAATQQLQSIDAKIAAATDQLNQLNAQKAGLPKGSGQAAAIDSQATALTDRIGELTQSRVAPAEVQATADGRARVLTVTPAATSSTYGSSRIGALILLALVGLALGLGGAVLVGRLLPPVIEGPDDASAIFGGPILAMVPRRRGRESEPLVLHERGRPRARAIHSAAAMLESSGDVPRRILVVGIDSPAVTARLGVNLAISLARHGHEVSIVGTERSHARALATLGVSSSVGYGDLVQKAGAGDIRVEVDNYLFAIEGVEGVWVLAPGDRRSTAPLRAVDEVLRALEAGSGEAGMCIVLAPPELDDPHIPVLARVTGATVWVVDAGTTRADQARLMADRLAQAGAHTAGIVLIGK